MKKNTSWKFTDELSVTFQSSVSGAGEFGPSVNTHSKERRKANISTDFERSCQLYWFKNTEKSGV